MNNMKYLAGVDDNGARRVKALERFFGLLFILALAALSVGCLVGNEEYDQASREVDEYQSQLQSLRLTNDQLNRDIGNLYEECEALNTQLATLAALSIHDRFTENLKRPEPVVTPPQQRPTRPATTPRVTNSGNQTPRANTTPRQGGGGSRGSGSQAGTPRGGQQSGGGAPATPPPPPPRQSGGAIDWGF